jgi:DNA-binding phage protein
MSDHSHPSLATLSPESIALLVHAAKARDGMERAARDITLAADELRRYAKFSKPGQPSVHIVQLRQKQATARMDAVRAKQAFLQASQAFVHAAGLTVPPRVTLEAFMQPWLIASA